MGPPHAALNSPDRPSSWSEAVQASAWRPPAEPAPRAPRSSSPAAIPSELSASLLGDQLEARRNEPRTTLPIGRVVGPEDVAALAVHIMINTALTGATFDIDGGQQFV